MKPKRRGRPALRRRWPWIVGGLVLAALVIADRAGLLLVPTRDDMAVYDGTTARVSRIINAHTLELDRPDPVAQRSTTHVRLWGLNAPRLARPGREAEPLADDAFEHAESLALDQTVTLRLESHRTRDTFGRLLGHVELPDGRTLNEALLEAGLARADDRWPHAHLERYARAEQQARTRQRGLWAPED